MWGLAQAQQYTSHARGARPTGRCSVSTTTHIVHTLGSSPNSITHNLVPWLSNPSTQLTSLHCKQKQVLP